MDRGWGESLEEVRRSPSQAREFGLQRSATMRNMVQGMVQRMVRELTLSDEICEWYKESQHFKMRFVSDKQLKDSQHNLTADQNQHCSVTK